MSASHAPDLDANARAFADELAAAVGTFDTGSLDLGDFDIASVGERALVGEPETWTLRRARRTRSEAGIRTASLVNDAGVLRWLPGTLAPSRQPLGRAALGRSQREASVRLLRQVKFRELPPNKIGQLLNALDARLTPNQGLHRVTRAGNLGTRAATPRASGRIALLVHGTFSSCEHMLTEIKATADGQRFLDWALTDGPYDQVLGFNHPTLSVAPILNAVSLSRAFRQSQAVVDVICHSRGGLVTRWWREALDLTPQAQGHTVFVGSPLAGTGLAAPANLKGAMDVLTNFAAAMRLASHVSGSVLPLALPLTETIGVLMALVGGATRTLAGTPLLDAGIALIPGLAAQGREGANGEILRMREGFRGLGTERADRMARYHVVRSNFETADEGWKFWRYFRGLRDRALDTASDLVFSGDNDLVVDTASMDDLGPNLRTKGSVHDFGTSDVVHHCNYFQQPATIEFLRRTLAQG